MKRREENIFACLARQKYGEPYEWDMQQIALADVRQLIGDLEGKKVNAEEACRQILENTRAFHYHYLAVQTLRELGREQKLSVHGAKTLLHSTAYTTAYFSNTENGHTFEENVRSVLAVQANVSPVVQYVKKYLLDRRELRNWRFQAFMAAGQIAECWGESKVPIVLKRALRLEAENEENSTRKQQFEEVLKSTLNA